MKPYEITAMIIDDGFAGEEYVTGRFYEPERGLQHYF